MVWVELAGAIISALAVWMTAIRHPWCWPVGLVSVVVYGWVFVDARLYSDALLQVAFGVMIVYGWVRWMQHLDSGGRVRIAALDVRPAILHLALGFAGALALGFVMRWTNAALPWLDAALTAFSLVAQWWEARRHIAAWWLWIVVDTVYIGEYIYKDLRITAVLYAGFLVLAVIGWRAWKQAAQQVVVTEPSS
ncbi:MAG TPA: nicotinamide riboside transporter PnuC [Rhodanobacteraceae bacterium]|nr:nicotinamide riboside transporter PnuC [Rhodanobacteraceae bacterium]